MTLEEYIVKRKREDGINEYDLDKRLENTRICVNYIFEYFNNYLEATPAEGAAAPLTAAQRQRITASQLYIPPVCP